MLKPASMAILCTIGLGVLSAHAADEGEIRMIRIGHSNDPRMVDGIHNNQLAADIRVSARIPQSHEAYGWRYTDAFAATPSPTRLQEARGHQSMSR